MEHTPPPALYLDPDAAELLAQLAPAEDGRSHYVSELIRAAARTQQWPVAAATSAVAAPPLPATAIPGQGLLALLRAWREEAATVDPLEATAELEDFKYALNTNRYPEPPLFP